MNLFKIFKKRQPHKELIMWLARDKEGGLYLYREKPYRGDYCWHTHGSYRCLRMDDNNEEFSHVKWEGSPCIVKLQH